MKKTPLFAAMIFLSFGGGWHLSAQQPVTPTAEPPVTEWVRLRTLLAEPVRSPQYDASVPNKSIRRDGRREWLMITAEYDTAPEWIDEITFTYYVVLKGDPKTLPQGAKDVNLFSGTVTLVNVPRGNKQETTMFLDPNTLARYGRPTHVAVVMNIRGQLAAGKAEPADSAASQWWTKEVPHEIPLLSRDKTPWAMIEVDLQGTIKP